MSQRPTNLIVSLALTALYAAVWSGSLLLWRWSDWVPFWAHATVILCSIPIAAAWILWALWPVRRNVITVSLILTVAFVQLWQVAILCADAFELYSFRAWAANIGIGGLFLLLLGWVVWGLERAAQYYERLREDKSPDLGPDLRTLLTQFLFFVPAIPVWARRRARPIRSVAVLLMLVGFSVWSLFVVYPAWRITTESLSQPSRNIDFSYLSADTELVAVLRPAEILESPSGSDFAKHPLVSGMLSAGVGQLHVSTIDLSKIDSIVLGVSGLSAYDPESDSLSDIEPVIVVHGRTKFNRRNMLQKAKSVKYRGTTYFRRTEKAEDELEGTTTAFLLPNPSTLVIATEDSIRKAIKQGKQAPNLSQFDFLETDGQLVIAVAPKKKDVLKRLPMEDWLTGLPESVGTLDQVAAGDGAQALAVKISFGDDYRLGLQVVYQSEKRAAKTQSQLDTLRSDAEKSLTTATKQNAEFRSLFEFGQMLLGDISIERDGAVVSLDARVPDMPTQHSMAMANAFSKNPDDLKTASNAADEFLATFQRPNPVVRLYAEYRGIISNEAWPNKYWFIAVAFLLTTLTCVMWKYERQLKQQSAEAIEFTSAHDRPWWVEADPPVDYTWNPLDADAWYYGKSQKRLNQSVSALVSYSVFFLAVSIALTRIGGCEEIYEMPAGGGEQAQIAQKMKVQKVIKKKFVINPFSSIVFKVPPIDEVKLQLSEITKHAYTVGFGKGDGAGFAGGTKRGKVRFIRLEYTGGDWNQDFGVGADVNMLIQYGIRTKHKVAARTESRRVADLKNFPVGKSPPMVYLTGQRNISLSKSEISILREYLTEKHGMLFGDNGGSSRFHTQFIQVMNRVLPNIRPVPIPLDDPIHRIPYPIPFLPFVAPHGGSQALGWKVDGRWICYYHPGDIGDAWADLHAGVKPEVWEASYQLGTNVIFYAHSEYSKWLAARSKK
jgi:hypothetical protein